MRRSDREIIGRPEIDEIIRGCDVLRLAFAAGGRPYLVPVSFGFDGTCLYFHTAGSGRKIDCIEADNRVCFELEREVLLVTDPDRACRWSFTFESVVGFGTVHEMVTPDEKASGLQRIMEHYSGRPWNLDSAVVATTRVWRVEIESLTGKRAGRKRV